MVYEVHNDGFSLILLSNAFRSQWLLLASEVEPGERYPSHIGPPDQISQASHAFVDLSFVLESLSSSCSKAECDTAVETA